jgi:peptidoglycan hydrolase-like protein with peptidoglycan-binding domain
VGRRWIAAARGGTGAGAKSWSQLLLRLTVVALLCTLVLGGGRRDETSRAIASVGSPGGGDDGGGGGGGEVAQPASSSSPSTEAPTTTTTAAPPTTTTVPPTTTTAPPPPPPPPPTGPEADGKLSPGENGEAVRQLQQRLTDLGYWVGNVDGGYGLTTQQAVLAFQKAEGLDRDGVAGPQTLARLPAAVRTTGRSTSGNLIEIDLSRQLLLIIQNGKVLWVINTSSGKSSTPTPPGRFTISRQIDGYRHAELGTLYRPKYFNGGIAIHGSPSIPGFAASHACTRVANPVMDMLWSSGLAEIGTTVWVY